MKTRLLLLLMLVYQFTFAQVSDANLIAYYPFNADANNYAPGATSYNLSFFGTQSTNPSLSLNGGVQGGAINNTNCYTFSGSNAFATDDFNTLMNNNPNQNISVSFWLNPTVSSPASALNTYVELFGSLYVRGGFAWGVSTINGIFDSYAINSPFTATNWSHLVMIFDAETESIRIYRNGVLFANKYITSNKIHRASNKTVIGGGVDGSSNLLPSKSYNGRIDEMYVFNRVLTASEITALYNKQVPTSFQNPPDQVCWKKVSSGLNHVLAIKQDGTLWAWGNNTGGKLGNGNTVSSSVPIQIGSGTDWQFITAGEHHSLAIKKDGTLWAWGNNNYGQLGDGTLTGRLEPIQIGNESTWTSVAAGHDHSLGIKNGILFVWGRNHVNQLGVTGANRTAPHQYSLDDRWIKIAAGYYHSFAINNTLRLYGAGFNSNGQVGNSSTNNSTVFNQIGAGTTWRNIAAGGYHSLGVFNGSFPWSWGSNSSGQLGSGGSNAINTIPNNVGITITPLIDRVAAGENHTLLLKDGVIYVTGRNDEGQLGFGIFSNFASTFSVMGSATNWLNISCGRNSSYAINLNGELYAWGDNSQGQLGLGNTTNYNTPQLITCPITTLSSANFNNLKDNVIIYPNPFNNQITFDLGSTSEKGTIRIYDISGKQLYQTKFDGNSATISDLGSLTSGIYLATLTTENGTSITKKIVK